MLVYRVYKLRNILFLKHLIDNIYLQIILQQLLLLSIITFVKKSYTSKYALIAIF